MIYFIIIVIVVVIGIYLFITQPKFGRQPDTVVKKRIASSTGFKNGQFQNQSITPDLTDGATYYSVSKEFFFKRSKRRSPKGAIPSIKTDLNSLQEDSLVWMGHSSYYLQVNGKRMLIDPVLSGAASPVKFTTRSFAGSDIYSPSDIPTLQDRQVDGTKSITDLFKMRIISRIATKKDFHTCSLNQKG